MCTQDIREFKNAIREISYYAIRLNSEFDRVRCTEWVRKLLSMNDICMEEARIQNQYAQYLKIMVKSGSLYGIYHKPPPAGPLRPLPEALGTELGRKIPGLPAFGPIDPYICQKSPDGKAFLSIKKIPGHGAYVYMGVNPNGV
ncbi:hypothetical protein M8J76_001354 [Diaphorina citri]|nr:hypothetical protein M8J75_012565 [Diaphorina citri]KAI5723099.1 hypothetical protein M8J76_001354 [Diaphorina citri]